MLTRTAYLPVEKPIVYPTRWAIHFCSKETSAPQLLVELARDGIHVYDSVEKRLVSRDTSCRLSFDRVLLIEVPSTCDDKLYFPEVDQTQGRYAEWPYCLDAYQYSYFYVPGQTMRDDAAAYDRHVKAQIRFRVPSLSQRLLPAM